MLTRAVDIYAESAPPLNDKIVNALDFLASEYQDSGDLAHAEVCYRRAIELERAREPQSWVMGRLLGDYVDVLRRVGDPKAEEIATAAAPIWKKHEMRDSPSHVVIDIPFYGDKLPTEQRELFSLPYSQYRSQPQLGVLRNAKLYSTVFQSYRKNARPAPTNQAILEELRRETAAMLRSVQLDPQLAKRIQDPARAFQQLLGRDSKLDPILCNQALLRGLMAVQGGQLLTGHELTGQEEGTLAAARALNRQDFRIRGGIGVFLQERAGRFFVSEPFPGGPAQRAGLKAGDAIDSVGHQKLSGLSMGQVQRLVTGEIGSKVELQVSTAGEAPRGVSITRAMLQSSPLTYRQIDNLGYIRMRSADSTLSEQLAQLRNRNLDGLILDLRQARGGLNDQVLSIGELKSATGLEQLSEMASSLLAPGTTVAVVDSRKISTSKEPLLASLPLVVLIDKGTADSPEILAAALKQRPKTTVLGERSSGRSALVKELPVAGFSDLTLRIACQEIADASGQAITGKGVVPHETLSMDAMWIGHESKDTQLSRAIALLK